MGSLGLLKARKNWYCSTMPRGANLKTFFPDTALVTCCWTETTSFMEDPLLPVVPVVGLKCWLGRQIELDGFWLANEGGSSKKTRIWTNQNRALNDSVFAHFYSSRKKLKSQKCLFPIPEQKKYLNISRLFLLKFIAANKSIFGFFKFSTTSYKFFMSIFEQSSRGRLAQR